MFRSIKLITVLVTLFFFLHLSVIQAQATLYYVSNNGNDSSAGTTAQSAWKTLGKVSSFSFQPGDQILLARGSVWREQLTVSSSGTPDKPIVFGAYDVGVNPLIIRSAPFSAWEEYKPGQLGTMRIWRGSLNLNGYRPRALVENGVRKPGDYLATGTLVENFLRNEVFVPENNTTYFYYRKDSGPPINTEVGMRPYGIFVNGVHDIIVNSIDVKGPPALTSSLTPNAPIYIKETSSNITIRNLTVSQSISAVEDGYWNDSTAGTGAKNVTYDNITAFDTEAALYLRGSGKVINCKLFNNGLQLNDTGDKNAINIQGGPALVEGNEIYNNGASSGALEPDFAIEVNDPVGSVTIIRNYLHDFPGGGIQITSESTAFANNHLIAYNIIDHFGYGSYSSNPSSGKFSAVRIQRANDVKIFNNVIARGGGDSLTGAIFVRYNADALQIKNNIFYLNTTPDYIIWTNTSTTGFVSDNNIFYRSAYTRAWNFKDTPYGSLSAWQTGQSQDLHSQIINPQFVNAAAFDYHLTSVSKAIDAGTNIGLTTDLAGNTVPKGLASDIGAYEYVSDTIPSPIPSSNPTSAPTSTPAQKAGDATGDNLVNLQDFTVWLSHYGQSVSGSTNGDFDNNSLVDGRDYVIWMNNFGK
jgi:hypothetical protein